MIKKTIEYETMLFSEIWDSAEDFTDDWDNSPFGVEEEMVAMTSGVNLTMLFYLLYARYGNNPIANMDVEQWKYKVFSTILMYGPSWAKRLDIQKKLRDLSDNDILAGSKAIYNRALNPGQEPSTASLEELTYINEQNTTNYKRSKLEAYGQLWELLETDVTNEFLNKFVGLFKKFVRHEKPLIYITETEEDE